MKSVCLSIFFGFVLSVSNSLAQNYALVEHFTNTWCPICTNKNPQLFSVINNNKANVHHIAYHPPYPYSQCIFYQANIEGNQSRADFYNVPGSPSAYVGGVRGNQGGQLLSEEKVLAAITRPLMVEMTVTESEISTVRSQREIRINIKTIQTPPAGNYRLFTAIVEKEIAYNSPNRESLHHDVFRKMLPNNEGQEITLGGPGEELSFTYTVDYESGWQQDEIYAVVFIQNMDDKSITGSATKFDNLSTKVNIASEENSFRIRTNPVSSNMMIVLPQSFNTEAKLSIHSINGQLVYQDVLPKGKQLHDINVTTFNPGIYIIQINHDAVLMRKKFIKQ